MTAEEKTKYVDLFLKGLKEASFPSSLASILELKRIPSSKNKDKFKLLEYELEKHGLVEFIRGRDNSTLSGQCEYFISGKGLEYVLNNKSTIDLFKTDTIIDEETNLENRIENLTNRAKEYSKVRDANDIMKSEVNSFQNIALYTDWFLESRELFSEYFSDKTLAYKEFCEFNTNGNGFSLSSKFSKTYPLFKILVKKIKTGENNETDKTKSKHMKNKIFIVHGHNNELKLEIARFVENDFKKEAVILHERANKGREILGKFEDEADVDIAIAIWSKDDLGKVNKDAESLKPRARQNVIFETGYFIGKLGRDKVIVILEDGIEAPSDYSGLMYISSSDWKYKLSKELTEIYK